MFGFGRKNRPANEINRLLGLLKEDPKDTKNRLTLANLYLQAGDQEMAMNAYLAAAKQLSAEGLDLEPIAIYKKILSLDARFLTKVTSATVQEAEELLLRARRAYEQAFQMESQDDEAKEAPELYHGANHERKDDPAKDGIPTGDGCESVPIEIPPAQSDDETVPTSEPYENPEGESPHQEIPSIEASLSDASAEPGWDSRGQEPLGLADKALDENDIQNSAGNDEITPPTDSSYPREDSQIDLHDVQMDDDLETMLSDHEANTSTTDRLPQEPSGGLGDRDLSAIPPDLQEPDPREESSQPDTTERRLEPPHQEDPDLSHNRGMAYYEIGLMDKAIKEFAVAHNQGIRTVESLSMLAKCYSKKRLFHNAAGFIGQALKLDNLTQDQIDMLKGQLEEIKAKIDLTGSTY